MSTPRNLRVSQSVKRELSEMLLRDIKDERISGIVSITDVESSGDCRSMKVFVSVFGDESQQNSTMEALNEHAGRLRGEIARRLRLRVAPEMYFKLDKSLERGAKVTELISKISRGEI